MNDELDKCCGNCKYKHECENYKEEHDSWLCLSWKQGHGQRQLNLFGEEDYDS